MTVLGKRLKEMREKKRLSQQDAAKLLGISNGTLSGYERNYRKPDTDILEKIADLYEVSVDYLMGRTNDLQTRANNLNNLDLAEDDQIHFFDMSGLSEEDIEFIKGQIEFLRKKAKNTKQD